MKSRFLLSALCAVFSICSCSNVNGGNSTVDPSIKPLPRMKIEESTSSAISMIEYQLGEWGYDACEGTAHDGTDTFYGIIFSKFDGSYVDEEGSRFFECGFFQIISDVNNSGKLLTHDLFSEDKPIIAADGDNNKFVVTQLLPSFPSFSYIYDDWYNVCKRVGDFVFEVNTYENEEKYYDLDISCYSYDEEKWLFKSDEDILAFNVEATGFYSDYSKAYLKSVSMFQSILDMQNSHSYSFAAASYAIVSGEILNNNLFGEQKGTINGVPLSELLAAQKQLQSNEVLSITPDGIEVVADTTTLAGLRTEKGIISLIANSLLIAGEVMVMVATWGSSTPIMAVAIATSVSSIIYAASNVGEAIQDIVLGAQGDIDTKAINVIKEGFIATFGDEKAGTLAFNIWGIANTIVSSLICPVNSALTQSKLLDRTISQTVLAVVRVVGVTAIEAALVGSASALVGMATGSIVYSLTKDELLTAYATDSATLVAALAIGFGIGVLENKYNFNGISKSHFLKQLKRHLDEDVGFKTKILTARNSAGEKLKAQALKDILNGGDPTKYGLDPSDPSDKEILDFVFENGRFPSFKNGDKMECQFAHAVDVSRIEDAAYRGKISWGKALEYMGSPDNGVLTSNFNHRVRFHGGAWTNSTNYQEVIARRPEVSDFINTILRAIGAI